jgi:hypothetical protein
MTRAIRIREELAAASACSRACSRNEAKGNLLLAR